MPRVFISYSHDSADHEERVLALAERLRKEGVDAQIDQYVAGTPPEGWPHWMLDRLDWAEFVLVVCTETYYRRFRGREEPGKGKGAAWEGNLITLEMYDAKSQTTKFAPVFFAAQDEQFIPDPVRGHTHYLLDSEDNYAELYRFLTGQAGVRPSKLGSLTTLARKQVEPLRFDFSGTPARRTIHNLPFRPNPLFTGREAELETLSRGLQQGGAMAVMQMVAVHGLGGVGKTQLALEYAWRHLGDYEAVFWVKADSAAALDVSLAALAAVLGLPEALEQAVQTKAVLEWLRDHQRWLLIADNADTDGAKTAVLERLSPRLNGHVFITSKISDWPVNIRAVRLDPLSPDEATRYLLARGGHDAGDQAAAGLLAQELGNLPIALEQAASFVVEVRWTFDRYRQQLPESRPELLSVAKTWSITLNQLTPLARALLRIAAWWFAIDAIPRGVFAAHREVLSEALGTRATIPDLEIDKALGELNRFSLIRLGNETFSVHRLLQAVEQDSLTDEEKQRWRAWAIRLSIGFTSDAERKHLLNLNLGRGRTSNYQGRHSLRSELRHLRWMGLLAMKQRRKIGDIRDNLTVDLSDYVYLTPNGKAWVDVLARTAHGGGAC